MVWHQTSPYLDLWTSSPTIIQFSQRSGFQNHDSSTEWHKWTKNEASALTYMTKKIVIFHGFQIYLLHPLTLKPRKYSIPSIIRLCN